MRKKMVRHVKKNAALRSAKKMKPIWFPTDVRDPRGILSVAACEKILEEAGVVLESAIEGAQTRAALIPHGWKLAPSGNSFFECLTDGKGRMRARIFSCGDVQYADLCTRYSIFTTRHTVSAMDGLVVLYPISLQDYFWKDDASAELVASKNKVSQWLSEQYPDWKNPAAYWK